MMTKEYEKQCGVCFRMFKTNRSDKKFCSVRCQRISTDKNRKMANQLVNAYKYGDGVTIVGDDKQ